mgnify:FL=1
MLENEGRRVRVESVNTDLVLEMLARDVVIVLCEDTSFFVIFVGLKMPLISVEEYCLAGMSSTTSFVQVFEVDERLLSSS